MRLAEIHIPYGLTQWTNNKRYPLCFFFCTCHRIRVIRYPEISAIERDPRDEYDIVREPLNG